MRSDEILQRVRLNATIEDTATDYPDAVLLAELNDAVCSCFEKMVVASRAGYWLDQYYVTVVSPQPKYRIPPRACVQGLEKVEIGVGALNAYTRLSEVTEAHAAQFETVSSTMGPPRAFVVRGDQVVILPNPDSTPYTLRMHYYRKPSRLVTQQSSTLNGGTIRGLVTAVNVTARTITVNTPPFDMEAVSGGVITPAVVTTGNQRLDVVHPDGWHECAAVDLTQTLAGNVFTIAGTDDLNEIAVGDYVRVAQQTDWAQLPDDFHRCLADVVTVKVLAQRNMADKASDFAQSVSADIQRFQDILLPRVKAEAITIKAPLPGIRGRPRWYWPGFP